MDRGKMAAILMAKSAYFDVTKDIFLPAGTRGEHAKLTALGLENLLFAKRKVPN